MAGLEHSVLPCASTGPRHRRRGTRRRPRALWASDGPDTVENGLCLCSFHHKLLDRDVLGVSTQHEVTVSANFVAPVARQRDGALAYRPGGPHASARATNAQPGPHRLAPRSGVPTSCESSGVKWKRMSGGDRPPTARRAPQAADGGGFFCPSYCPSFGLGRRGLDGQSRWRAVFDGHSDCRRKML